MESQGINRGSDNNFLQNFNASSAFEPVLRHACSSFGSELQTSKKLK